MKLLQQTNRLKPCRQGFTIVEVLVALTITMIMMGALAQAFKYMGTQIQSGRAAVELSGKVRASSVRLRDELRRVTAQVAATPPLESPGQGYFMVYEGPMSDASTALYGFSELDDRATTIFRDSRYGDFDDYLAFTAEAPAGSWFTGKVPRFVLEPKNPKGLTQAANAPLVWLDPVEITSKYAEIVYWLSPEWVRDANGALVYGAEEVPLFVDDDGNQELDGDGDGNDNGIPDRLVLRRRVLLIRPDLIPDLSVPGIRTQGLLPKPDPLFYDEVRYPFAAPTSPKATTVLHSWWMPEGYFAPNYNTDLQQAFSSNWLTGMQLAYQLCDLSLGRRVDARSTANTYGKPLDAYTYGVNNVGDESVIQMNSLNDLMRAEYRFAHVRLPQEYIDGTSTAVSMPLLALTGSSGFFSSSISGRAHNPFPASYFPGVSNTNTAPLFNGFVLPHFELGNLGALALNDPRWNRTGEDVIATNVLGFDVQVFDPEASVLLVNGTDAAPGVAGVDDNSNTVTDDVLEQGTTGSDDALITPDDPAYFSALLYGTMTPASPTTYGTPNGPNASFSNLTLPVATPHTRATVADRGAFVDLGYAINAGSPLRDLWAQLMNASSSNGFHSIAHTYLRTPMSGYGFNVNFTPYSQMAPNSIAHSLVLSGKASYYPTSGLPTRLFQQVVFDTGTNSYESDGFDQSELYKFETGPTVDPRLFTPFGTWWKCGAGTVNKADEATNGMDDPKNLFPGEPNPQPPLASKVPGIPGVDDPSENETSPPIVAPLKAVRIRLRLEDPATRQFKQIAIVHDFED